MFKFNNEKQTNKSHEFHIFRFLIIFHSAVQRLLKEYEMKKLGLILLMLAGISCSVTNKTRLLPEDQLFVTRKYVGDFVEGQINPPAYFGSPHILLITTTLDSLYGKISAYSRKCDFRKGERLYVRRIFQKSDVFGSWIYRIENESPLKVTYQISEIRNGDKILAQDWY